MAFSEHEQMNAFIGLSKRMSGWPSILCEHGYILERIELYFEFPDPKNPAKSLVTNPDLFFVADQRNMSLIIELKSGTFQDFEQLKRLIQITPTDLVRYAQMPISHKANVINHKISFMEVVNVEHLEHYEKEFKREKFPTCLVSMGNLIRSHHHHLNDNALNTEFRNGITIEGYRPQNFLPILPNSDDKIKLKHTVLNAVKALWSRSQRSLNPLTVAQEVYNSLWDRFDTRIQARFINVATDTLKEMAQSEFFEYMQAVSSESKDETPNKKEKKKVSKKDSKNISPRNEWVLLKLPEAESSKNLVKAQKRFQKLVQDYKTRTQNNTPFNRVRMNQMSLADIEGFMPNNEDDENEE